jgi:hypothetical protein
MSSFRGVVQFLGNVNNTEEDNKPLLKDEGEYDNDDNTSLSEDTQLNTLPSYEMIDQFLSNTSVQIINDYRPLVDDHNYHVTDVEEPGDTNFVWTVFNLWNDVLGAGYV